ILLSLVLLLLCLVLGNQATYSIKYPGRKSSPRPKIQESLQASTPLPQASKAQESVGGRPLTFQNISPVSRVQGAPDTSELARTLTQKFRRKLMSDEEIEYIKTFLHGGPLT
uniref:Uncharacterized protein n=1 Tax=Anser brachyrhynchus TaxID=132585 RepID=A0A8B9CT54_9AVES